MSLRKQIKKFFTSLEKTKKTEKLMADRINLQVLEVINDYAELLAPDKLMSKNQRYYFLLIVHFL